MKREELLGSGRIPLAMLGRHILDELEKPEESIGEKKAWGSWEQGAIKKEGLPVCRIGFRTGKAWLAL